MPLFSTKAKETRAVLESDPDIKDEARSLAALTADPAPIEPVSAIVPLNVVNQSHRANAATCKILEAAGGLPALRRFTSAFYKKVFADTHIDQFIRSHDDPHGERFATWIAEKFGLGQPWTEERRVRPSCPFAVGRGYSGTIDVQDRSSAHFAAWHSPKRAPEVWGEHFKLDDCRVWMRLHFWAAREAGLLEHAPFADYYCRFIGHFVSVYERTAPPFARDSMRWSADAANIERYLASGRRMPEIMKLPLRDALSALPEAERDYTGSSASHRAWPYEL